MFEIFEIIKNRNKELLSDLLSKYQIDKDIDILVNNYESVFLSIEYQDKKDNSGNELKRVILYANLKHIIQNNEIVKTNKKEILYNFGRKLIKKMEEKEINLVVAELHLIVSLIKQLKLLAKIEFEEAQIQEILNTQF